MQQCGGPFLFQADVRQTGNAGRFKSTSIPGIGEHLMTERDETMARVYRDAQAACGLKIGDWVKLLRKAESREAGWQGAWDVMLNGLIGKFFQICAISDLGIQVKYGPSSDWKPIFPYFVLGKVEKPAPVFKPFDRVLVRLDDSDEWRPAFSHRHCTGEFPFRVIGDCDWYKQCISYEGNEHLCGTTDTPEE